MQTEYLLELHKLWCNIKIETRKKSSLILQLKQLVLNLLDLHTSYIFISNSTKLNTEFISPEILGVLGYPIKNISLQSLLEKIQSDDFAYFLDHESFLSIFKENKLIKNMKKFNTIFEFQTNKNDSNSLSLFEELTVIQFNADGNILKKLLTLNKIKKLKFVDNPKLSFIGKEGEVSFIGIDSKKTIYQH